MSGASFWNPRAPAPQAGSLNDNVEKQDPSFWYPRKYDLSAAAWKDQAVWSQPDPVTEIQYTYLKHSAPPPPTAPKGKE